MTRPDAAHRMNTAPSYPDARTVSYSDVYGLDPQWGRRTEDTELWTGVCGGKRVLEIGCGDGRVPLLVGEYAQWVGIDSDPGMCERFTERVPGDVTTVCGSVTDKQTWANASDALAGSADVAIVPFSTLYLVPHDDQAGVLRSAGGLVKPGGLVVSEMFVPQLGYMSNVSHTVTGGCRSPDGIDQWVRVSVFDVEADKRVTSVARYYGPVNAPEMVVHERIYWRMPAELPEMANQAGFSRVQIWELGNQADVPRGHVVLVGTV